MSIMLEKSFDLAEYLNNKAPDLKVFKKLTQKRELEPQIKSGDFERTIPSKEYMSPVVTQTNPEILIVIKDNYVLDFVSIPPITYCLSR